MKRFFFISGLPRSGSTLLCNILAQNDELFVSKATSGCHDILFNVRNQWDKLI
ncbi:MAG: sulfotransferase [Candidatus Paceibacterota bacterium]